RQHLIDAMHWGLFGLVRRHPREWDYTTINQRNRVWGLRIGFHKPPGELATFTRSGRFLRADGSGTVRIRFPGGTRRTRKLPFSLKMP
ncbi:MAG: hypothetical protein QOJ14_573, partial [Thermoleophilaceae bacterium]|nr:hypothetical protein [Thermoleophilaceae bacterium]